MSESAWIDFTAGWISGGASLLACQPIDTVLTRAQARAGTPTSLVSFAAFRGMVSDFGLTSLWRGSSAMVGAVPVQNALLWTGYGAGKRWSAGAGDARSDSGEVLVGVFAGGCVGGVFQSFVMSPVEMVKVTQQVHGASIKSAAIAMWGGSSPRRGVWRGLGATLLRDGIPHGVWFASYEYAKVELSRRGSRAEGAAGDGAATPMLAGAFAAATAWAVGYPFDLIKTRIQASSGNQGVLATATEIVNESGGRGLYKGFALKLCRAIPASVIGFLTYEMAAEYLTKE